MDTSADQDGFDSQDDPAPDAGPEGNDGTRVEELGDRIQKVRDEADDVVEGVGEPDGERYTESGGDRSAAEDDQTIAPPG